MQEELKGASPPTTKEPPFIHEVLNDILDQAIAFSGAERGFVVHLNSSAEAAREFKCIAVRDFRFSDNEHGACFSRTVVARVTESRKPIVLLDASNDEVFQDVESVKFQNLRSIAALPLTVADQVVGALYLENRTAAGVFSADDLPQMEAFANVAALALASSLRLAESERLPALESRAQPAIEPTQVLTKLGQEIRNPLNGILGFSQLLLQSSLSETQSRHVQRILDGGRGLMNTLQTCENLSHLETQDARLQLTRFNFCQAIQSTIASLETLAIQRELRFEFECSEPVLFRGDAYYVDQMFASLMNDALALGEKKSVIRVSLRENKSGPRLRVQYHCRHHSHNESHNPLNLYLVERVIAIHGGTLESNCVGSDVRYDIWLPSEAEGSPDGDSRGRDVSLEVKA